MDKYTGKKLDGRYEIHELIGVGGMANVYRCYDTIDDREVAIKILKDEFLDNADFIRRFKNESKSIAVLSHPNIVRVYDVSFGDVIQYIVMEYIDGITLKEYIAQQKVIKWKEALHLTTQILRALQHAHEKGIVHRDIKPQNIMLLQDGTIKVTDFGIARNFNSATRTMTEQAIGSVHYIAPEQAKGGNTDGKTDIYSVGVMMYEMLTGKLPFVADNAVSVALMQLQSTPKLPRELNPELPIGLQEITLKAMQKDPKARYSSAQAMLDDIDRFRLNPKITFGYKTPKADEPTKYVETIDQKPVPKPKPTPEKKKPEPNETDDKAEKKERTKGQAITKGVLIALLIAVVGFGIYFGYKAISGGATDISVPDFVGKNIVDVQQDNEYDFNYEIDFDYDSSKEDGVILAQKPEPDSKMVKQGATIELTVNGQESEITVPHLINTTEEDAVKQLESRNLNPEVVYIRSADVNPGYVSSEFPSPGTKSTIGSTVYVYVSKGTVESKVTVPDVTGKPLSEAAEILTEKNLQYEFEYDNNSYEEKDTVIRQNPLQGGKVKKNYTVKLILSGGKKDNKSVDITVQLPAEETNGVSFQVTVDGDVYLTTTVVPSEQKAFKFTLTGAGEATDVKIYLNGQLYQELTINFQNESVGTPIYHDYVMPTTATEPTTDVVTTEDPNAVVPTDTTDYYNPTDGQTNETEPVTEAPVATDPVATTAPVVNENDNNQ
ncbi:MAG: Stk1 family PASTA domain-containing Ser/Thr kinase [Ruminococcus sp.]|nr:Stk1 family PASTA domain-containing Ser/Thr kinase [Ruminococcus sp.]